MQKIILLKTIFWSIIFAGSFFCGSFARADVQVSITDYGAIANDGLDDSAAFNAAIAAVMATGGTVTVPAGTFVINSQVKILNGNGINIIGTDRNNSKIVRNVAIPGYSMFLFLGGQNNLVKELTIDCQDFEGNGVRLQTSNSTIENVSILNCPDRPFSMNGGGNNYYGVQTNGATMKSVVSVSPTGTVVTSAAHNYHPGDMVALVSSALTLSGVADDGALFAVKSVPDSLTFTIDPSEYMLHNTAGQTDFNLRLSNASYNDGLAKAKIIDFYPTGCKIINSYAKDAGRTAFSQKRMRESEIVGNTAEDISSEAITVDGGSYHALVAHNILKNIALNSGGVGGIGIDHASDSTVINNTIIGVQNDVVDINARIKPAIHFVNNIDASRNCTIKDNYIEDARFGIYLKGTSDDDARPTRLGSGSLGANNANGDNFNHLITGNSFKTIGTADVFVEKGAQGNQITGNRHIGNGTFISTDQNDPTSTNTFSNNGATWSTPPLVFVLAGQSNMMSIGGQIAQIGANNDRIPDNVDFYAMTPGAEGSGFVKRANFISTEYNPGQFLYGPEVGLAKKLTLDYPNRKIIIIKYAVGSTSSCQWKIKNSDITSNSECLVNGSTQTIQQTGGTIRSGSYGLGNTLLDNLQTQFPSSENQYQGFIWFQGEADSEMGATTSAGIYNYPAHIKELWEALKTRFNAPALPMAMALISRQDGPQDVAGFRATQITFAADNANVYAVDSKDLVRQDVWHMNPASVLSMGGCFASALETGGDVICPGDNVPPSAPTGLGVL